ncbi:F-box only protein 39-like isoform X2 [Biomphalaria glabrata]|uniref:F-box only protein 39-like isoform X2 n=1 Tax=Biomphalaria glabrata TaxID=6526 RepID=A0A9W2ZLV4_BIOGL|nr:F-box only protein 39-like isoform X2 [Biomphalaria glabrata]
MWELLPDEVLLLIFKYLKDSDLNHASVACKKWRRVYIEPCLWRSRTFEIRGYCSSQTERIEMLTKYVNSMGEYLQYVRVVCHSPNLLTAHGMAACVDTLLSGLSSLKDGKKTIRAFQMSELHFHQSWGCFRSSVNLLADAISAFLRTQTNLRHFDMNDACMSRPHSYRIIKALLKSKSMKTLQSIHLLNFYDSEGITHNVGLQLRTLSSKCCCLKEMSLNYSYLLALFGDVENKGALLPETLERLSLLVNAGDFCQYEEGVMSSEHWKGIHSACPNLQVHFYMDGWPRNPTKMLVPKIPLAHFCIGGARSPHSTPFGRKTSLLLDHLALHFDTTLKSACFFADSHRPSSPSKASLVHFLIKCRKLTRLVFSECLVTLDYIFKVKNELNKVKNELNKVKNELNNEKVMVSVVRQTRISPSS